jgi:hypothetical protein
MMSLCERCKKWVRIKSILFCFAFTVAVSAHAAAHKKYLIEFGWDEPDSHYLREHITEMEKLPFDGCVFHIKQSVISKCAFYPTEHNRRSVSFGLVQ